MYKSLEYIKKYFPYFLNKDSDSSTHKVCGLIDKSYKETLNSLEKVQDGYYFLQDPSGWMEHISITREENDDGTKSYNLRVTAEDLKHITITNTTTKEEIVIGFEYDEHKQFYTHILSHSQHDFMVEVGTWNEYSYKTTTSDYNSDLDLISNGYSGSVRRDYTSLERGVSGYV